MKYAILITALLSFVISACNQHSDQNTELAKPFQIITPQFAKGYQVEVYDKFKLIKVFHSKKTTADTITYALVPKDLIDSNHSTLKESGALVVPTPIERLICFSTTHVGQLNALGLGQFLVGFPNPSYLTSAINKGSLTDIGEVSQLRLEEMVGLESELIMAYAMDGLTLPRMVTEHKISPFVYNLDYLEDHPLGQAEWMKFIAYFFDEAPRAEQLFEQVVRRYDSLKTLANKASVSPQVMSGNFYGNIWYAPGGHSWMAHYINDAGGKYITSNQSAGSQSLTFEQIWQDAQNADVWIGLGPFYSLNQIKETDHRYTLFAPFKNKQVYNYILSDNGAGANAYFELGAARPDLVLADLIDILHPGLLKGHRRNFYKRLGEE